MRRTIARKKYNAISIEEIPTYYGLPVLKKSDYLWKVGLYIYVGGLAAGSQLIATAADWLGVGIESGIVTLARGIAFIAAALGGLILISHLHVPQRFYNMLRIFRLTSSMSIGVYLLLTFGFFSAVSFAANLLGLRSLALAAGSLASILALGMATYTAPLLASTATPLWSAAPMLLAVRFAASAIASAAALLCAIALWPIGESAIGYQLAEIALLAISVELIAALFWQLATRVRGVSFTPWGGRAGSVHFLLLVVMGALPIPLYSVSLTNSIEWMAFLASVLVVAMGPFIRVLILHAGNKSADRPHDYFRMTGSVLETREDIRKEPFNGA